MIVVFHNDFRKKYRKLPKKIANKFDERLTLFKKEEFHPILNNHALKGKWFGYRSINATGDIRAIFKREENDAIFVAIDSHSNLYK